MKNLQIITNSYTPARVDFNYQQIADRLDIILDQYKGLEFTEESVADCKRTMAELRKGQKSLDDYRKETKKKLTASVTEFENDCKVLYKKFDEVIDPLKEQADLFESMRREGKKQEIEGIIEDIIGFYELTEKYSKDLIVQDKHLIASISIKKVTEELELQARYLKDNQDEEELNIAFITETIEKINKDNEFNLLPDTYIRTLDILGITETIRKIYEDESKLVKMKELESARLQKIEFERIAKELELENQRIAKEEEDKRLEELDDIQVSNVEEITEGTFNINDFEKLPQEPQKIHKIYNVLGNSEQLKDLETFLNAREIEWEII